jgi:DNA-binding NarL/FixJ family response regulator
MNSDDLSKPLERIGKILAGLLLKDVEDGDQRQKIKLLKQCGFDNSEIAEMLGTTVNTVNVTVHGLKKKRRARR